MGGHGAAAARKGWREIDDPETKDEVRSLFLKRGIQRGTYDPRRGGMGWSDFFFGEIFKVGQDFGLDNIHSARQRLRPN